MLQKQHATMRRAILWIASAGLLASQTFEVASVKPVNSAGGRFTMTGGPGTGDPGRFTCTNIMLRRLLLSAYDVKNYQLLGPDWLDTLRYDIAAKVPDGATKADLQAMMRNLLETRFQMTLHRETRELPIYELVVARNGSRLKANGEDQGGGVEQVTGQVAVVDRPQGKDGFPTVSLPGSGTVIETKDGRARATSKDVTLAKFAEFLSGQLGRPVVDRTNLTGTFSFSVYFTPEALNAPDSTDPGIFSAIQEQLGLKLEARRGPVELLIVDRAERTPIGN
jgi:uncharacterized protein (TIGR03435 family)